MELTRLTSRLSTSAQIRPGEIEAIAAAGFRSIICNRPDEEGQGRPTADEIGAAARAPGLGFARVPACWHGMRKGREWMVKPHLIGR